MKDKNNSSAAEGFDQNSNPGAYTVGQVVENLAKIEDPKVKQEIVQNLKKYRYVTAGLTPTPENNDKSS